MSKDKNTMTLAEQLCYNTTLIKTEREDGTQATATGFLITFYTEEGNEIEFLVTNRHVADGSKKVEIRLNKSDEQGNPIDAKWIDVSTEDAQQGFIYHPNNADLAIYPVTELFNAIRQQFCGIFYRTFPPKFIVTDKWAERLDAIEDVIMVGYPHGIFDKVNNRPIVRRGITATDPKVDYNGEKQFLIDCACFPGCSGSPVLVYKKRIMEVTPEATTYKDANILAGIQCAMQISPKKSKKYNDVEIDLPLNLGYVIKAQCLFDFIPLIEEKFGITIDKSFL